jgi:Activator of Hsp90 ATPase homolog 1-like protein
MDSTRIEHHIKAPRAVVYRALLDPRAVAQWKVPDGMTCHVHAFDTSEGGSFRISLTYDAPTETGKTTRRDHSKGEDNELRVAEEAESRLRSRLGARASTVS